MKNDLRMQRQKAGFTLDELAARTKMHKSILSRIENGIRRLKADELPRLASALGCAPQDLIPYNADSVHTDSGD